MKASEIDWSKAPEGATHWDSGTDKVPASWMKLEAGDWFFWSTYTGVIGGWVPCGDGKGISSRAVQRPELATWNGTGLPPAGCEIEYRSPSRGWRPGEYIGQFIGQMVIGCRETGVIGYCPTEGVRPVRTPEQIAADERVKAVAEMMTHVAHATPYDCDLLYRAGYRKVEGDKQ